MIFSEKTKKLNEINEKYKARNKNMNKNRKRRERKKRSPEISYRQRSVWSSF
jgi:hypothetical protein